MEINQPDEGKLVRMVENFVVCTRSLLSEFLVRVVVRFLEMEVSCCESLIKDSYGLQSVVNVSGMFELWMDLCWAFPSLTNLIRWQHCRHDDSSIVASRSRRFSLKSMTKDFQLILKFPSKASWWNESRIFIGSRCHSEKIFLCKYFMSFDPSWRCQESWW